MKILKTNTKLYNFKGEVLKEDKKEIEAGIVLSNIMSANNSNPALSYQLGKKFACDKTVELKAEDVVFVKNAIELASTGERAWVNMLIAGQLIEILEASDSIKK